LKNEKQKQKTTLQVHSRQNNASLLPKMYTFLYLISINMLDSIAKGIKVADGITVSDQITLDLGDYLR